MKSEPWKEPTPTVDQLHRLVNRIGTYFRRSRVISTTSTILLSALMLEFMILIYSQFPIFLGSLEPLFPLPEWYLGLLFGTFIISMLVYGIAGNVNERLNRLLQVYRKIGLVVKLDCANCDQTEERTWSKFDYVFKEEGKCDCGGSKYISEMYLLPLPIKKKDFV